MLPSQSPFEGSRTIGPPIIFEEWPCLNVPHCILLQERINSTVGGVEVEEQVRSIMGPLMSWQMRFFLVWQEIDT